MTLYFAYGSNLNKRQMLERCPGAIPLGALRLKDHALVFRHVADIVPEQGATVYGAVWKLTPECEAALDVYEGIRSGLYRKEYLPISAFDFKGEKHNTLLVYVMNSDGIMPPPKSYLYGIREGYRDFRLPMKPLNAAVEAAHDHKAPSHVERARHRRKGRPELAERPSERKPAKPVQAIAAPALKPAKSKRIAQADLFRRSMIVYGD